MNAVVKVPFDLSTLRQSPSAVEAEQAVLGMLMLVPESLAKVSDWLTAEDFYRKDHRLIYKAICSLVDRGSPVDPVTLGDWFEANALEAGGIAYLAELADSTASAANIVAHAEIVVEKARLREAIDIGCTLTEGAYAPGADSQRIVADATHDLAQIQASKMRGGLVASKEAMRRFHAELMERYNQHSPLVGMPTPWREINEATKGLRDGLLYIVGARPNMGKSIFALQQAGFTALRGDRVAMFSVEMTEQECMARLVAGVGQIPHEWVENPVDENPDSEMYWSRLASTTSSIIESPLLIDATPGLSIAQLVARAKRAHMQKPLRLVVIDHMHDMWIDPDRQARFEYGLIAQGVKTLAKELNCPVVLLAQLNRGLSNRMDKHPTMTDLRESGEIEQKADVIFFLHRDDYYDKKKNPGQVEVIIGKGRNIKTGTVITLKNSFDQMRLDDYDGPSPDYEDVFNPPARSFKAPA